MPSIVSSDAKEEDNKAAFEELFKDPAIQAILHTVNLVIECLDPKFTKALIEVMDHRTKQSASMVVQNLCHMIGLAVHFNRLGKVHLDIVIPLGQHSNCVFEFEQLNTEVNFDVTDMGIRAPEKSPSY